MRAGLSKLLSYRPGGASSARTGDGEPTHQGRTQRALRWLGISFCAALIAFAAGAAALYATVVHLGPRT